MHVQKWKYTLKHVKTTATFKSQQANKTWMTFHNTYYKT